MPAGLKIQLKNTDVVHRPEAAYRRVCPKIASHRISHQASHYKPKVYDLSLSTSHTLVEETKLQVERVLPIKRNLKINEG